MKRFLLMVFVVAFSCLMVNAQNDPTNDDWSTSGSNTSTLSNVGIGISVPAYLLHVAKFTTEPHITVHNTGSNGGATFRMIDDLSGADFKFKSTFFGDFKIRDQTNALDVIAIRGDGTGWVRIGTGNPTSKLDVDGIIKATGGSSTDWNTAFTWGDHSTAGYLTTESDPLFSSSLAAGIFSIDTAKWNSAYAWGNHALAGYLTTYSETDPSYNASIASSISGTDTTNWNTAYGWGNHASAGYLTSYTETDPVYLLSVAAGITSSDTANWNNKLDAETDPEVGANTLNTIPKWDGSSLVSGSISDVSGNVGIGIANPASPLMLEIPAATWDVGGFEGAFRIELAGSNRRLFMGYNYNGPSDDFAFISAADFSTPKNLVLNFNGGNVGIGTEAPTELLDVDGKLRIRTLSLDNSKDSILVASGNGTVAYRTASSLMPTETDPKVGSLTANKVPKWNGTTLQNGLITDDGSIVTVASDVNINSITVGKGNGGIYANTAFGESALLNTTTGDEMVAIGYNALKLNTDGDNHVAIGAYSMQNNTSSYENVAVGFESMRNNTMGSMNVAVGGQALKGNTTGSKNIAIGLGAGASTNGDGNIFIGWKAGETATVSDKLFIDNTNTADPLIWGDFANDILKVNGKLRIADLALDNTKDSILVACGDGTVAYRTATSLMPTETDPMFNISVASGINGTDTTNWNSAYGWGNHSLAGYLTTETDGDPANEIQTLSFNSGTNELSLTGGGNVDLSSINGMALAFEDSAINCQNKWTQKANYGGSARDGAVSFTINGTAYVGLGYNKYDFWKYDQSSDSWTLIATYPGTNNNYAVAFVVNGKAYVGTGLNNFTYASPKNEFWEYDPNTNTWTQKNNFGGSARFGAVAFVVNGIAYVACGTETTAGSGNKKDVWQYIPDADTSGGSPWVQKADMGGNPRWASVAFSLNGKGYITTGYYNSGTLKDLWEYTPEADSIGGTPWIAKANFGGSTRYNAVGFTLGSKAYVGLGYGKNDVWEYDPAGNNWTAKANFPGTARGWPVAFSSGGKGFVTTGRQSGGAGTYYKDVWEFCNVGYGPQYNYSTTGIITPAGLDSLLGTVNYGNWTLDVPTGIIYNSNDNNVGIGTSMPSNKLTVAGNADFTGNVGIGTSAPGGQFELSLDQGRKPSTNTWTITSDERLKDISGAYEKGLAEIMQLEPIKYHYKNVGGRKFDEKVLANENVGFSAQEVQKVFPEAVGTDDDGYLNFNIHPILIAQVNAIKEQQEEIENQNQQITTLQAAIIKQDNINKELKDALQQNQIAMNAMMSQMSQFDIDLQHCCLQHSGNAGATGSNQNDVNDKPHLAQNVPNPFSEKTVIKYYLPISGKDKGERGMIQIMDLKGIVLWKYNLVESGYGQIEIDANTFAPATYIYEMIVGDKKIDSKKMVIE